MEDIIAPDINISFISSLYFLRSKGSDLIIRGKGVRERTDFSFHITFPERRILTCPRRYNDVCATIAETLWVFAGRDDLSFLSHFLPNAIDFSDNHETWRGAYGPRIKYYDVNKYSTSSRHDSHDQIESVIEALKKDKYSRQAIIVIPDPWIDYKHNLVTKDRPCTVFIQFLIRDGQLDCYVKMRSNDIIWGCYNINVFEWTFLQEAIANILDVKVGSYGHNAVSFHYYHSMNQRVENILEFEINTGGYNVYSTEEIDYRRLKFQSLQQFYKAIDIVMNTLEEAIADEELELNVKKMHAIAFNELNVYGMPWFIGYLNLPLAYLLIKKGDYDQAYRVLTDTLTFCNMDMVIAGLERLVRHAKKNGAQIGDLLDDMDDRFDFEEETLNFVTGEWQ